MRVHLKEFEVSIAGKTHVVYAQPEEFPAFAQSLTALAQQAAECTRRPVVLETRDQGKVPVVIEHNGRKYTCEPVLPQVKLVDDDDQAKEPPKEATA